MNEVSMPWTNHLGADQLSTIHELRTDFVRTWKEWPPRIEDYLERVAAPAREALLAELVKAEIDLRIGNGEAIEPSEFRDRFPGRDWLDALLPSEHETVEEDQREHEGSTKDWNTEDTFSYSDSGSSGGDGVVSACPPGYEILDTLGRGGMGVVYKARQTNLDRVVALKMIKTGSDAVESEVNRFRVEAEAIARLQHPHIVQIFEIGEHRGNPYFSLEFCSGGTLSEQLEESPLRGDEAGKLVETLARALQAAHEAKVLHRDLKPANVLLTADSQPKIADFGLAKKLDDKGETQTGAVMGTPSYMAPEQALGKIQELSARTDVYALGAILYSCLTGRAPFKGATPFETIQLVGEREPVSPRVLQPSTPIDLETICMKCLEKSPEKRYGSAEELAEDLRRYREGEPIQARPVGRWGRLVKWAKRHPGVAVLSLILFVVVAATFSYILRQLGEVNTALANERLALGEAKRQEEAASQSADRARHAEGVAKADRRVAVRTGYFRTIGLGFREWEDNRMRQALERLEECSSEVRGPEYHLLDRLCHKERTTLRPHASPINTLALSADGTLIAAGGWDDGVSLLDARTGEMVQQLQGHSNVVNGVCFSPDGKRLVSVSAGYQAEGGEVRVWNPLEGHHLFEHRLESGIPMSVAYSPDGKWIVVGTTARKIYVLESDTGAVATVLESSNRVSLAASICMHPTENIVASTGSTNEVTVWSIDGGKLLRSFSTRGNIHAATFSADGSRLIAVGYAQPPMSHVWAFDMNLPAQQGEKRVLFEKSIAETPGPLKYAARMFRSVACSPDSKRIACGSYDGRVIVLDMQGKELRRWDSHPDNTSGVVFSRDSREIISAGWDGSVLIRDVESGKAGERLSRFFVQPTCVAISPKGDRFATGSAKQGHFAEIAVFDMETREKVVSRKVHRNSVTDVVFSPDGKWLASSAHDGKVLIWDVDSGKLVTTFTDHKGGVRSVTFHSDSNTVASVGEDGLLLVWNRTTKAVSRTFRVGRLFLSGTVRFQPGGDHVAVTTSKISVVILDTKTGKVVVNLSGEWKAVSSLSWKPDGKQLAIGADGTLFLWDLEKKRTIPNRVKDTVNLLEFGSSGSKLLFSNANTTTVWDLEKKNGTTYRGHTGTVNGLAFHPDGLRFISTATDESVRLWHIDRSRFLERVPESGIEFVLDRDSRLLACTDRSRTRIRIWDVASWKELRTLELPATEVKQPPNLKGFSFGRDSKTLVACLGILPRADRPALGKRSGLRFVRWDLETGATLEQWDTAGSFVGFDPVGKAVFVKRHNGDLERVREGSGEVLTRYGSYVGSTVRVTLSPDGTRLVIPDRFNFRILETATGKELHRVYNYSNLLKKLTWNRDGSRLCSSTSSTAAVFEESAMLPVAKIWDTRDWQSLHTLEGHHSTISDTAFNSQGTRVASVGQSGTLKLWDVESGLEVLTLHFPVISCSFGVGDRLILGTRDGIRMMDMSPRAGEN